jgi:zinc protease
VTLRAIAVLIVIAGGAHSPRIERLPAEQVRLGNGLTVLLAPDASVGSVAVHVRYAAPLVSERSGEAGYTRALERQLAAGSVHVTDAAARIEAAGGWATTATTADFIGLTEQVPTHALPLVLWLEAERMAGVADVIHDEALRRFTRERIAPNHALLVIAGRFDVVRTRRLVERYFGWIPAREGIVPPQISVEPRTSAHTTQTVGEIASVVVSFRCEGFDPAIELVGQVLAGGASSRLPRAFAQAGLAVEVRIDITRMRDAELRIVATPGDGVDPAAVATIVHRELTALRTAPPSDDELARARALLVTDFAVAMELLAVRAELLASWATIGRGGSLLRRWPELLTSTSREQVAATIAHWLGEPSASTAITVAR